MGIKLCNAAGCPEHTQPGAMEPQPLSPQPYEAPFIFPSQGSGTLLSLPLQRVREGTVWGYGAGLSLSSAPLLSDTKLLGYSLRKE